MTIEEILKEMLFKYIPPDGVYAVEDIAQAHSAIKQLIGEMIPPMKNPNILPQQRLSTPDEIIYNQVIAELQERLTKI